MNQREETERRSIRRLLALCAGWILGAGFVGLALESTSAPAQTAPDVGKAGSLDFWEELAFWESVKDSSKPADLEAYLATYPNGRFRRLAEIRLKSLRAGEGGGESAATDAAAASEGSTAREAEKAVETQTDASAAAGQRIQDCELCPKLVVVPAGERMMGSDEGRPEERPRHRVVFSKPFAIGIYEVSVGEWDACLREGACRVSPESGSDPKLPMSNLSWDDTRQYLDWLKGRTGKPYRLPSEAEWEYAAGAGTSTRFWWGDSVGRNKADCSDCGSAWDDKSPAPVGSFAPNPFGLYDVHGNLWEWTQDCVNRNYAGAPTDGSAWLRGDCLGRMLRGGAWKLDADYMRTTKRHNYDRDVRYYLHGFRVARDLP